MSEALPNFEGLLRQALVPVEPPEDLATRLEDTLQSITAIAAEELEAWELSAMRDPRKWVRPALALVAGSGAGAALVLLRARHRQHQQGGIGGARHAAERALEDLAEEARKLLGHD